MSFSPKGDLIATGEVFSNVSVRILRVDGEELEECSFGSGNMSGQNVFSLAFSPDGCQLATGFDDGTIGLWDLATQQRSFTLHGHARTHLNSVAYSPDGKLLASGSSDHSVRLWDPTTGECTAVLQILQQGPTGRITGVAFSPDGKHLAASSGNDNRGKEHGLDSSLRLWGVATRECFRTIRGHAGSVKCVAWSPDGRKLVTGSSDHTARVWDALTGECESILYGHSDKVVSASFSRDGKLATGSTDNTARLWDHQR